MKTTHTFFIATLFSCIAIGCSPLSTEKKAENLISDYIKKTANDPDSYEPVSFSKLDYYVVPFDVIDDFPNELKDTMDLSLKIRMARVDYVVHNTNKAEFDSLTAKIDSIRKAISLFKIEYDKKQIRHYVMTHKFRAKNAMGALMLAEMRFTIDTNLTNVLGSINTSDIP